LRIIVCVGLLVGVFFSLELWFPLAGNFPRVPVWIESPIFFDRLLTFVFVVSLFLTMFFQRLKIVVISAISSLVWLMFFDQIRLQPWVHQYLLLLIIFAFQTKDEKDSSETLGSAQIIIAGLYFWSGVQKLNFTFSHETLPILLEPLQSIFPSIRFPFVLIGITIALIEILIGGGLLFRKARNVSVVSALAMHIGILTILVAKNYNQIVWIWNLFLIAAVVIVFWKNDASVKQIITFAGEKERKISAAKIIALASVLLPVLSFFGVWDAYLSGALYSGNTAVGVVRINDNLYEKLPPKARESVFKTKNGGEKMLPLLEWSLAELNVPAYPAQRVFEKVTGEICKLADDQTQVELIVKERPAILDGKYNLTRTNCEKLGK
jgi:hypothetical protein